MSSQQCFIMNLNRLIPQSVSTQNNDAKPPMHKEKVMSYEEKSVGSTPFYKCEACPYMALAEDDIKFHLFTAHPDLAKTNGLADNIQIPCPGCTSIFDAELTLRTHLRNHHKMGIKDIKIMVKSLVQIALKNAKLKKEDKRDDPLPPAPIRQGVADINMPQVIEIVPDIVHANNSLPQGVTFISVDELQKMSTPNFEAVDPKEIIQEASINIVYNNPVSQYLNVSDSSISNSTCSLIQMMPSTTPDLISSIQPRVSTMIDNNQHLPLQQPIEHEAIPHPIPQLPKPGRPKSSKSLEPYNKDRDIAEKEIERKLGKRCSPDGCRVRLKDEEKLSYHRKCHQNDTLQCPECNKVSKTVESLHTHLWKGHAIDMELPTCEVCGYKAYRKRLFNVHMKCHENVRAYTCEKCSKSFKNASQLSKHRVAHNKDSGIFKCAICQRVCTTEHTLKAHIAEVHNKLKQYKCPSCNYTVARPSQLKLHLRSHTGDKPYNCNKCSYRSGDHNAMRRHKRTHSKESLYQCKYCPYSAIQSTSFASHMITKHPNVTSSDIHRCPYCSFKSVSREKYVLHLTTHPEKEGVKLLIEMTKEAKRTETKPSWTIPSENAEDNSSENTSTSVENKETSPTKTANKYSMELYNCDSQQESIPQNYAKNYSTHTSSEAKKTDFHDQIVTDFSKDDNNSDCLISESSNDTLIERQYPPLLQSSAYENTQTSLHSLITSVSMEQNILQSSNASSSVSNLSPIDTSLKNIMSNFPIRLPPAPLISVRNNITLKPVDKIFSMTKVTGPIIKPTQILPVPSSSNSPVNVTTTEPESGPRKKPKISVKSNLILKGPDQVNMFHSQQKMAFKRLEDNERFGLGGPVTFNNLITTQFMQLPPEPTLSESPTNIIPFPQETLLDESATPPVDTALSDNSQIFNFNQQINVSSMSMLPPQPKIQTTDPSYIKLESTIKQNTQSPSLERMCTANTILHTQPISREYKASPPLEDIHKNMSEIKNEVKSDYYNIPLSNTASNPPMMDQYLMDNLMGEQYPGHIDISSIVLPPITEEEDQQNDVIEIDDNSDDNKLLPRFDMNFPLESMYLMHNEFHFLENDMPSSEAPVNEMNRMVTEVPILSQKESNSDTSDGPTSDFPNFIQGKKDPMMNTSVRPTNKINVKNIELMKN